MIGALYLVSGTAGSMNVDIEVEASIISEIEEALDGATVNLNCIAVRGYTGNAGLVYIQHSYEELCFQDGIVLYQIKVLSVNGASFKDGLYPEGSVLSITGIYNIGLM